ncbi:hypothetical protein DVA86_34840 [Streptomyces armeniacus]|uniref:Uncharacterized protein n=1 Tax=Streptomyces armeniacus TaxID=83291 RepID=A0A345XZ64_9ACTN|nr:hypothetical protein [Streptomyces armeniacus]AXK36930.1 hypothetical protein DVA86_34840 [Streptomyces armeniacus]
MWDALITFGTHWVYIPPTPSRPATRGRGSRLVRATATGTCSGLVWLADRTPPLGSWHVSSAGSECWQTRF